jgi:probable phosphoglycerate mutase
VTAAEIVLVRHAETNFNVEGRISSDPLDRQCVLSQLGEQQAARLAHELAHNEFDLCVTSQLLRARQTAAVTMNGRDRRTVARPEFNDVDAGIFNNRPAADYLAWLTTTGSMGAVAPPNGESLREAVERYTHAFEWLMDCREAHVLVVTHALPIALVLHANQTSAPPNEELLVGLFAQRADEYGTTGTVRHAIPYRVTHGDLARAVDYWRTAISAKEAGA